MSAQEQTTLVGCIFFLLVFLVALVLGFFMGVAV